MGRESGRGGRSAGGAEAQAIVSYGSGGGPRTDATPVLSRGRHDAVLVDLDGVVTETAEVHAAAWKDAFDALLQHLSRAQGADYAPFDAEREYRDTVDGKPREDGIRDFLASRGLELPEGSADDPPDAATVAGLAKRKNGAYHARLDRDGVRVHRDALDLIRRARAAGLRCAVVSASRNTAAVLAAADLSDLFDLRVDGRDLAAFQLKGKPAPDLFLLAARRLNVDPARTVVLEDAFAGVEAGRAGGFGLVVGVARTGAEAALREHGADVALANLDDLAVEAAAKLPDHLQSAVDMVHDIVAYTGNRRLVVFLDYDGTLTPIVARPDLAVLSDAMRAVLQGLAEVATVGIISGRDRADVAGRVGLDGLVYAGSHGFDIAGPAGHKLAHSEGDAWQGELADTAQELEDALAGIDGSLVERKAYGVAVHYRQVAEAEVAAVGRIVEAAHERHPALTKTLGKKVYEFRPGIPWDKGKAVQWLLHALGLSEDSALALYLGDDVTDEDAFAALADTGIGILVGEGYGATRAHYHLPDIDAVQRFLDQLAAAVQAHAARGPTHLGATE
jgi:alpha,alpha-trehalase